LSVITIGEIEHGISKLPESKHKELLNEWLREELLIRFQNRILPLTTAVMLIWGQFVASGRTLPAVDSMIAATVLYHDLFLVTRHVKDFEGTNVKLVNPWES